MTPAARFQAAIEILDEIAKGTPTEAALTRWARRSRFAGSKDRAAIRDHVFDVVRRHRSCAALGGGTQGRALILGLLRDDGIDPATVFTGTAYAPAALDEAERTAGKVPVGAQALDVPDWLLPLAQSSLSDMAEDTLHRLRHRAPVFVRVNTQKASAEQAIAALADEGILAAPHALSPTALQLTEGARRLNGSKAYQNGLVELQDVASQAVVDALPLQEGMRVLDYCAGGGGKALAIAARAPKAQVEAWDIDAGRMIDLPKRAKRAGANIRVVRKPADSYDLILCDAPCSGSGAWRRAPDGKWLLTADRLAQLCQIQAEVLDNAARHVAASGTLAYATCSFLEQENMDQIRKFLSRAPEWRLQTSRQFLPADGGDGFFYAVLART